MATLPTVLLAAVVAWLALVLLFRWVSVRWLTDGPRGEPVTGLMWRVLQAYCRLMHRPTYVGLGHVPEGNRPGGLVVVSNHTGPIDPLLIQSACRFEIRWMMAENMMVTQFESFWRRQRIIAVARDGRDSGPAREAIRHVKGGGVIGIFPEGGIAIPPDEIRPFHNGVGLIISRTKAPVLLVWVTGTPEAKDMPGALGSPSRSRIEFVDLLDFSGERDPAAIAQTLRKCLADASGWPLNDEPLSPPGTNPDPFAIP